MDATQAKNLVAETLGGAPLSATHQTFGHNSITYEVALPGRSVIVRMNREPRTFATTEHNLAVLNGLGLPTPTVLAVDFSLSRVPFAYMILDRIPGRDLRYELSAMNFGQMTRLAEQIVGFQKQVGQLPQGRGYGYVGIGETAPFASWAEVVGELKPKEASGDEMVDRWQMRVRLQREKLEPYLRSIPPTCFLDDITGKNVIVQDGELQGLVDFDCVCYGDPLFWLALTATGIVSDIGMRELFYVEELKRFWGVTPEQAPVLALYTAGFALDFLLRFHTAESPEWNARMRAAVARWTTAAERSGSAEEERAPAI